MIKNILLTVFITVQLLANLTNHEYYVGLTEITYKPEKQSVEIISRLFYDDFEKVLKARYDNGIVFTPSKQSENVENYIKLYFSKKLSISIDGSKVNIEYLGFKFDQDRVNLFLKIENVKSFNSVNIENLLLTDLFEEQKNIVHCFKLKQKKSVLLTRFDSEALLKFN